MQSAIKIFFFKPGMDVNKEMDAYLQKVTGWEVVSISHQLFQGVGTSIAVAFRVIGDSGMKTSELEVPAFLTQLQ